MTEQQSDSTTLSLHGVIEEQQLDKRLDAKLANELLITFNALDRLVTMMRVYPKGHPILDEIATGITTRMREMMRTFGEFEVNIGARELKTGGGTAFFSAEQAEKKQFIYYSAYADGVIRVTFLEGLTSKELQDFMGVINRSAQGLIGSDDDTVTLLWELNLEHITYAAVEGFVDSGALDAFGDMNEAEAIATVADAAVDPRGEAAKKLGEIFNNLNMVHLDLFTRMQIDAHKKMAAPALSDRDLGYAFGVDAEVLQKLLREWSSGVDLEYRLIEALLSIVRTAPQSEDGKRASALIVEVMHNLLDKEMFAQAARVLELLHDRRDLFSKVDYDPVGELIEELSDPLRLEALVHMMQTQTSKRDELMSLLTMLGPSKVQWQLLLLLADEKRKIVALPQVVELVVATLRPENESQLLAKEIVASPTYFKRILPVLAEKKLEDFKPMARLIRAALHLDDLDVLKAAMTVDHPVWADDVLADKYLQPMATHDNEEIRKLALRRLGEHHAERFRNSIRDSVLARKFTGRTHAELRFLMRIFLESSPDAPATLRQLLQTRGWLNHAHREFAKMAGAILMEVGDAEAISFIRTRAASFWTHPELRQSWQQSLDRFASSSRLPENRALPAPVKVETGEPVVSRPKELRPPIDIGDPLDGLEGPADARFVKPDQNGVYYVDGVPSDELSRDEELGEALHGLGTPSESWNDVPGHQVMKGRRGKQENT